MIERYRRPAMTELWSERAKLLRWLEVEVAVLDGLSREGVIPAGDWRLLKPLLEKIAGVGIAPEDVVEKEKILKHDVIAFTAVVAEKLKKMGGEKAAQSGRFFHYGLTSSDVVDTAFSMTLQAARPLITAGLDAVVKRLRQWAKQTRKTPTIGRTHGMFAEPTTLGMKFLGWAEEGDRNQLRLEAAFEGVRFGKLSGAVGASPHWDVRFETKVLDVLGLAREPISTQVIPRDRHAELMNTFAILGSMIERIALELRHLQRSEVGELREGFSTGQKGSSAMPHKRNPISAENLCGCARLFRSYAQACLENVALWHERDISHSSVERVVFPDAFQLMDYALSRLLQLLDGLEVVDARLETNLANAGPMVFSGHILLALVRAGSTREEGYRWLQACALQGEPSREEFLKRVLEHPEISARLPAKEIRKLLSLESVFKGVDQNFKNTDR